MIKPKVRLIYSEKLDGLQKMINDFIDRPEVFIIKDIKIKSIYWKGSVSHYATIIYEETLTS